MKLSDYMAAGLPIAASDVGDIGDMLRRAAIGRVSAAQPQALADAVLALLGDAAERERLGRRARQVAEAQFAWPLIGARTERFYEALMSHVPFVA